MFQLSGLNSLRLTCQLFQLSSRFNFSNCQTLSASHFQSFKNIAFTLWLEWSKLEKGKVFQDWKSWKFENSGVLISHFLCRNKHSSPCCCPEPIWNNPISTVAPVTSYFPLNMKVPSLFSGDSFGEKPHLYISQAREFRIRRAFQQVVNISSLAIFEFQTLNLKLTWRLLQ